LNLNLDLDLEFNLVKKEIFFLINSSYMALISYNDFDFDFYHYMNDNLDLNKIKNKKDAYEDYVKNANQRIISYNKEILENFDVLIYILCNKDLKRLNINNLKYAEYHFIKYGYEERRIYSLEQVKKILVDFNWIEYIYLNKHLLFIYNDERDCIIHYLLNNMHLNKPYKCSENKNICTDFDWVIYTNYYHDLTFMKNHKKAFQHYIYVGIDEGRCDWIHLKNILYTIDIHSYLKNNLALNKLSKIELIHDWIRNDKNGKILTIKNEEIKFNEEFGIAISVYSDVHTPKERLYASFKSLNYLFLLIRNCNIYIIIDGNILENHFQFIQELKKNYSNCFIYKNEKNYGISITKNICIKILESNKKIKYFCLLDDDIFIKKNFVDYTIYILKKYDVPIVTNFNKALPYFENSLENNCFIKSRFFFGNILVFSRKYFNKFGYFQDFPYKWGEEHVEFTKRYMNKSIYENYAIDFRNYLNDEFIINNVCTLHLHSLKIDNEKVKLNKQKYYEFIQNIEYVDYDFNKYKMNEINF